MNTFNGHTGAVLHFDAIGSGTPIVALHGAYSASNEISAMFEPILAPLDTHRRFYPDLPGMGDSPAHDAIQTTGDIVDLLDEFIHTEIGDTPFLLAGHSYGGHLARGLAARRTGQVAGLALICPIMPATMNAEPRIVVATSSDPAEWLAPALVNEYTNYFVIHTPVTAERFRQAVAPALGRFDGDAVARVMTHWALDPDPDTVRFDQPTLVVTGRHDSVVGYRDQMALLDNYPHATFVVVADAGHAVPHEHPELFAALINDWLTRCASLDRSDDSF
jgi:pimeloyl-ACP methyl ester carboxylesterase